MLVEAYVAAAERAAWELPPALIGAPRPTRSIAVIGGGNMGTGIAINALDAGLGVVLIERDQAALANAEQRIAAHYRHRVDAAKLTPEDASARTSQLVPGTDWRCIADADIVIEAVFEDIAAKQAVFVQLDKHARPGAILASNTSYLDIDTLANFTGRPQDVLGLHFFSPANVMKLLEVVKGTATQADALSTGLALARTLGKQAVVSGNAFGFIGNRIYSAYRAQCEFMLEEGAWPEDIDAAMQAFGMAMGPFAVADYSGLDIAWHMRQARAATRDPAARYVDIPDRLCEAGRLGRKTGAGYYTYDEGIRAMHSDAMVRALIEQAAKARGRIRQPLAMEQIQSRAIMAMVNEAALLLQQKVSRRTSDIDVVMLHGYGFPKEKGGPIFWARQQGRSALEARLDALQAQSGAGFVRGDLALVLN